MQLFHKLSSGGKKTVKYDQLCKQWNTEVVSRLRSLDAGESPVTVLASMRLKTKQELQTYAKKVHASISLASQP